MAMDRAYASTFNNYDYENGKVVLAPHSPCPVLFGIRGDVPGDLPSAMTKLRGESPQRWLLFETNQGTNDHVRPGDWSLRPQTATSIEGIVSTAPRTLPGGHVLFVLEGRGRVTVATYEPSKQFRRVVRSLRPGDRVQVWGSVRDEPRSLNLERIRILSLAADVVKVANPPCPECGTRMKRLGRAKGYRCRDDHRHLPSDAALVQRRGRLVALGVYEPPACARRHLAMPLKRLRLGEARPEPSLDADFAISA